MTEVHYSNFMVVADISGPVVERNYYRCHIDLYVGTALKLHITPAYATLRDMQRLLGGDEMAAKWALQDITTRMFKDLTFIQGYILD